MLCRILNRSFAAFSFRPLSKFELILVKVEAQCKRLCSQDDSSNWLQCEKRRTRVSLRAWVIRADEFKFLEKSPDVMFMCNCCLGNSSIQLLETAREVITEIHEMKTALEEVKEAVQSVLTAKAVKPENPQDKLCSVVPKSKSDFSRELRLTEYKAVEIKPNRAENRRGTKIFEKEEKQLGRPRQPWA